MMCKCSINYPFRKGKKRKIAWPMAVSSREPCIQKKYAKTHREPQRKAYV